MLDGELNALVSVILPVYNCERFISLAIESILNQTYRNIELIIINDGSNDKTLDIVNGYSYDSRLKIVSRENRGLVYSLNEAIALASGEYIARMDADDISMPDRIEKQVAFLANNSDVAIVGSRTILIDEGGAQIGKCHRPLSDEGIRNHLYYGSPFAHPSIMYNLNVLSKEDLKYLTEDYPAEDLGLFLRISSKHKVCNLKQPLLKYRLTKSGISNTQNIKQRKKSSQLRISNFSNSKEQTDFVLAIDSDSSLCKYMFDLTRCLISLFISNVLKHQYNVSIFLVYLKALRRKILSGKLSAF